MRRKGRQRKTVGGTRRGQCRLADKTRLKTDWLAWLMARLSWWLTAEARLGSGSWYDTHPPASTQPQHTGLLFALCNIQPHLPAPVLLDPISLSLWAAVFFATLCLFISLFINGREKCRVCSHRGRKIGKTLRLYSIYKSIPSQIGMCKVLQISQKHRYLSHLSCIYKYVLPSVH